MYPRGSPKFNLVQATAIGKKAVLGAKKASPKITKRGSPKGISMSYCYNVHFWSNSCL